MAKPEQSPVNAHEPWWPPRLASPLWWDDRIAGWHDLWSRPARSGRRAHQIGADAGPIRPPHPAGTPIAPEPGPPATHASQPGVAADNRQRRTGAIAAESQARLAGQEREIATLRTQGVALGTGVLPTEANRQAATRPASGVEPGEIESLLRRLAESERQVVALGDVRAALEEQVALLQHAADDARGERDGLAHRVAALTLTSAELDTLRTDLAADKGRIAALETQNADLARQLAISEQQVVEARGEHTALAEQGAQSQRSEASMRRERDDLAYQSTDLARAKADLEATVEGLTRRLDERDQDHDELARQVAEMTQGKAEMLVLADSLRADLAARDIRVADLEASAANLARQLAERVAGLRDERTALEEQGARLRRELVATRSERDAQAHLAADRERAIGERAIRAGALGVSFAERDGTVGALEARAAELARERDLLQGRIADYQQTGIAHLNELRQLCAELARRSALTEHELRRSNAEVTDHAARTAGESAGLLTRLRRQVHGGNSLRAARKRGTGQR